MPTTLQLPLPSKNIPAFPDRCASCGAPRETESRLVLNRLVMRGKRQEQVELHYSIPHCHQCARSTKAVFLAGLIPFLLGLLLVGGAAFIAVTLGAWALRLDDHGQPGNANSLVLGAAAGLFAGLAGGFLFELAARVVLLPFFGAALFRAPLLAVQMLNDADYVAGLSGKLNADGTRLQLTFSNAEIAREFQSLNAALLAPE